MVEDQGLKRAKQIVFQAINKGTIDPVLKLIKSGFPINEPIMDNGMNLVIHAASTNACSASSFAQLLAEGPNVNA